MGWRNLISCFLTLVLTLGRMSRGRVLLWATPVAVEAGNTPGQGSMPGLLAPCYEGSKRAHLFPAFLPIRPAPLPLPSQPGSKHPPSLATMGLST